MDMEMYRCFETEQKLNIWADFKNKEFSKNSFRENIKYPKSKFSLVFLPSFRTIRYSCKWNKDVLLKKKKRLKRNDLCFVIFHFRTIEVSESSGCRKHRIELQSMRASSSRVHASSIEKNISSRNELAHNRTIHSRGGLSLSPPPVIISSFLPASFIKRCLASCIGPVSPIRFAESFHAQYTNPIRNESTQSSVFESLKYHEIRAKLVSWKKL